MAPINNLKMITRPPALYIVYRGCTKLWVAETTYTDPKDIGLPPTIFMTSWGQDSSLIMSICVNLSSRHIKDISYLYFSDIGTSVHLFKTINVYIQIIGNDTSTT